MKSQPDLSLLSWISSSHVEHITMHWNPCLGKSSGMVARHTTSRFFETDVSVLLSRCSSSAVAHADETRWADNSTRTVSLTSSEKDEESM